MWPFEDVNWKVRGVVCQFVNLEMLTDLINFKRLIHRTELISSLKRMFEEYVPWK
jgi:hypothetical protein